MFSQLFDGYRRATESWMQMQQDALKQMGQQWMRPPGNMPAASGDWNRTSQRRWVELVTEVLNKQRESIDWIYESGAQIIEQTFLASDAKSPEDYRRVTEELWRKLFDSLKTHSEAQLRDLQKWADKSMDIAQGAQGAQA
jgi:hypothetical protein